MGGTGEGDRWRNRGTERHGDEGTGGWILPSPSHLHPTPTAHTHTSLGL